MINMWHLVKKEHIFIFLIILIAFVFFNYFNFNFNSLVSYDDQTCVNQGYQCCIDGINQHSQFDGTCALNEGCYEYCPNKDSLEGLKSITGLGFFDFIKETFSEGEVTGSTIADNYPGQITNQDISIISLVSLSNNQVQLTFDVSYDVISSGYSHCSINWGDSPYIDTVYIYDVANPQYTGPYIRNHKYSSAGIKNVALDCEVYDPYYSSSIPITASGSIYIPSSDITGTPQASIISLGGTAYTNNPSTNGYVFAYINVTDKTKFNYCEINWDQTKDALKWRIITLNSNDFLGSNYAYSADKYTTSGVKTVYLKCTGVDGSIKETNKTVQVNLPGTTPSGNVEYYFRDGINGLTNGCNAPDYICSGTTTDTTLDKKNCSSVSCVFMSQCIPPGNSTDIQLAISGDPDSSLDKETCISYTKNGQDIGSWVDADIGDSNSGYGKPGQYCEKRFVNGGWIDSGYKWVVSGNCLSAQRWGNLSPDYCDDTAAGLSNLGATGEGKTSNYCCGDDPNEYYKTNTNNVGACCASQTATVDTNGNCVGGSVTPSSLGNIDIVSIETLPQNKTLHYSNVDVFCKVSTTESSTTIRNCVSASIGEIQCQFTRVGTNNVTEFRGCGLGGLLGNVTVQCSVNNNCLSSTSSTRSRTTNLLIKTPTICKQGDTEKDAIVKVLDISDVNLNDNEFDVGSSLKLTIDLFKDESIRRSVDVSLEAVIYDLTANKIVVDKKSSLVMGSRDDEKSRVMNLTIPQKDFMDEDDNYRLYVKAYESGKEDSLCIEYLDGIPIIIGNIDDTSSDDINDTIQISDKDRDGYNQNMDCNDNNALINPGVSEVCDDKIDNNCNSKIDENCIITPPPGSEVTDSDSDGIDDDWEISYFGDLITANSKTDFDKDGILDKEEFGLNTDPLTSDEKPNGNLLITIIIVVIIIIIVLGYLFISKKKPKTFTISNAKNANELEDYIKRTLRKGYKKQQITNILLTKGWHKSEVENAFKKVEQER